MRMVKLLSEQFAEMEWSDTVVEDDNDAIDYDPSNRRDGRNRRNKSDRYFVAIDGEGITHHRGDAQSYCVLGASNGFRNATIRSRELSTVSCLNFLLSLRDQFPNGEYVAFAFNYDVSMICKDLTPGQIKNLKTKPWCRYGPFRLQWRPGKWFCIKTDERYIKIFDVFTFFACKFTKAIDQYIPGAPELEHLETMKAKRGQTDWTYDHIDAITEYMHQELVCMVRMMDRLKSLLSEAGVKPNGWHGPGAVAGALLTQHRVRNYHAELPDAITRAASYAYYGGRFEAFGCGLYQGPVWQYDIRSAYPYALSQIPSITSYSITEWPDGIPAPSFSLCQVSTLTVSFDQLGINPIPVRNGTNIFYPGAARTWVWGHEYNAALNAGVKMRVLQCVRFDDNGERPFEFVGELYHQRAEWKRAGNPAQLAAKLGMNSVYGKLAQRIGWDEKRNLPPRQHSIVWAGYITSLCRSMIQNAINQKPHAILAVETDAVFTTEQLDLPISDQLGQWDMEYYPHGIMYVQSGVYFIPDGSGGWTKGKTRGFNNGPTVADDVLGTLDGLRPITKQAVRFHGITGPIDDKLRHWVDHEMIYVWGGSGKRMHVPSLCPTCQSGDRSQMWHRTAWMVPNRIQSDAHTLPWMEARNAL